MSSSSSLGTKGALLKCDVATAAIVKQMNDFGGDLGNFIIKTLDDTTLLVEPDKVQWIKDSVMSFLEENIWTREGRAPA